MKKIVCIAGPSAVGKTTLLERAIERNNQVGICKAKQAYSYTTRPLRGPEDKRIKISIDTFWEYQRSNLMVETVEYNNHFYGIAKATVRACLSDDCVCVLDCNKSGLLQVRSYGQEIGAEVIGIFLVCSAKDLFDRQFSRNAGSYISQTWRIMSSTSEVEESIASNLFDYVIFNGKDMDASVDKIVRIINGDKTVDSDYFCVKKFKKDMQDLIKGMKG